MGSGTGSGIGSGSGSAGYGQGGNGANTGTGTAWSSHPTLLCLRPVHVLCLLALLAAKPKWRSQASFTLVACDAV